ISATEMVLASGVLRTTTPRASAAARSTLSRPVPARTTTRRSGAPARTSAVTFVALRTSRPWTPFNAVSRSGAARPLASITSWPASRIRCTAEGSIPSQARTFKRGRSRRFPRAPRRLDRARGLPLAQRLGALLERAEDHVDVGEVVGAHVADAQHLPLGVVLAAGDGDGVRVAQALDHRARVHARRRLERGDRVRRALREQRPADRLRARTHRGAEPRVPLVHVLQALLLHHRQRFTDREDQAHRGRERALAARQALPRLPQVPVEARV